MATQNPVVEQKQLFLQNTKQLLSRGIGPSKDLLKIAGDGGIEMSVLRGVLEKVNRDLKKHSRQVYSRQMIEHVVEQIDKLYWAAGSRDVDEDAADQATETIDDSTTLHQSDDLTLDEHIAKLPGLWDTSATPSSLRTNDVTQDDYLASMAQLKDLSGRRQALQNKLSTYRTLLSLLEPYRQPKENIQPNLVWKDSPLAPELAKTRTLAIRVAGRVDERFGDVEVPATMDEDEGIDMDDLQNDRKRKVDRVLQGW